MQLQSLACGGIEPNGLREIEARVDSLSFLQPPTRRSPGEKSLAVDLKSDQKEPALIFDATNDRGQHDQGDAAAFGGRRATHPSA